jgi:hypothetical protein
MDFSCIDLETKTALFGVMHTCRLAMLCKLTLFGCTHEAIVVTFYIEVVRLAMNKITLQRSVYPRRLVIHNIQLL